MSFLDDTQFALPTPVISTGGDYYGDPLKPIGSDHEMVVTAKRSDKQIADQLKKEKNRKTAIAILAVIGFIVIAGVLIKKVK